jgi:hypothetical protein
MVQKPKAKGGLGVLNLKWQNDWLLVKQLHKFYNKVDTPWVNLIWTKYYQNKVPHAAREVGSFWWKDVLRLNTQYRGIAKCSIGNVSTVLFWNDIWSDAILSSPIPRLFSYDSNQNASVKQIMKANDLESVLNLPLSAQAYEEYLSIQDYLSSQAYDFDGTDQWSFIWGSQQYSSRKFYSRVFAAQNVHQSFSWVWKSKCTHLKFFAWLLLVDRLNTKTMLQCRNFNVQPNNCCVMCPDQQAEDIEQLFFQCPFAVAC